MIKRYRIGIVCDFLPYPEHNGASRRILEIIRVLSNYSVRVDMIIVERSTRWRLSSKESSIKKKIPIDEIYFTRGKPTFNLIFVLKSIYWWFVCLLGKKGSILDQRILWIKDKVFNLIGFKKKITNHKHCPNGVEDFVKEIATKKGWNYIIVEYLWLHSVVNKLPPSIKRLIDTHDVMAIRHDRLSSAGIQSPFPIDEQTEATLLNKFDCVLAIQKKEEEIFLNYKKKYNLNYDVITVGVSCYSNFSLLNVTFSENSNSILYVGGDNALNINGLKEFITQLWPEIYRQNPTWRLRVCGPICNTFISESFSGVEFLGVVEDLSPYYLHSAIVINPNWIGTGLKIKTIEAISYGKPLVTTPFGVEGMAGDVSKACLIASTPLEFLNFILQLIRSRDKRKSLSSAARHYYSKHLSLDIVYKKLLSYI